MNRLKNEKVKEVVILGSKPEAHLPYINVPVVLAANGGVELGLRYRKEFGSYLIGLVPLQELYNHQHICDSFTKAQPDEIVLIGGGAKEAENFVRNNLQMKEAKITVLSLHEVNWSLAQFFGWSRFMLAFDFMYRRGLKDVICYIIPDIFIKREFVWMHRSTGLGAVLYAMQRFPGVQRIVLGGIGLKPGNHYNGVGEFTGKTATADQVTISRWPNFLKKKISTTDEKASEISGFSFWQDDVFPND